MRCAAWGVKARLRGAAQARREADMEHPFGYAPEQYVWAMISGVGIFFLGCGVG
jgi:zinc transporter 9